MTLFFQNANFVLVNFLKMKNFAMYLTHDFLSFLIVPIMLFLLAFLIKRKDKFAKWIKIIFIFLISKFSFSILFLYIRGYIRYNNFELYLVIYILAFILGMLARIFREVKKERKS